MKTSIATSALLGVIGTATQMRVSIPGRPRASVNHHVFMHSLRPINMPKSVRPSAQLKHRPWRVSHFVNYTRKRTIKNFLSVNASKSSPIMTSTQSWGPRTLLTLPSR